MDELTFGVVYERVFSHVKQLPNNIPGTLYVVNGDNKVVISKSFAGMGNLATEEIIRTAAQTAMLEEQSIRLCGEEHELDRLFPYVSYAIPLHDYSKLVACLGLIVPISNDQPHLMEFLKTLSIAISVGYQFYRLEVLNIRRNKGMSDEVHRRDMLIAIANKFHSTMNTEEVVYLIVDTIYELYPDVFVEIYLSLDLKVNKPNYPIKSLNVEEVDELTLLAFRDGIMQVRQYYDRCCMALPIRGNQGVYGVLHIEREGDSGFTKREQENIQFITDAGGSAFENAQLYEQSRQLIQELRMINEMARQMNRSLRLQDVLNYIQDQISSSFKADYCLILTFDPHKNVFRVISSLNDEYIGEELSADAGILGKLYRSKESYIISGKEEKIGIHDPLQAFPHRSALLVPLLQNGEITGAIVVLDQEMGYFSYEDLKFLHLISQHTSLAITNATLHVEMERLIITDNLTGLHTRKYLNDRILESMKLHAYGSMLLIDVDNFKKVNDKHGHLVGDDILMQVSNILKENIRSTDVAARWGGEELVVYLPNVSNDQALAVAERIREQVASRTNPSVTVSIGVSSWKQEDPVKSTDQLFFDADQALYYVKNHGKNSVLSACQVK